MNDSKNKWTALATGLALSLTLTAAASAQVADVSVGDNSVVWSPTTGQKMMLTVSGPGGTFHQEYAVGEAPSFDVFTKGGVLLQDGTYSWELTGIPEVSDALKRARAAGEFVVAPQGEKQSGYFTVVNGYFARSAVEENGGNKDQVIADDLIVDGSACIGTDCANGENFGFDTLRLKENNVRIKFDDTSSSGSFPNNDWQLTANDSSNGGANKFSLDDITGSKTPFTIEAGAPNNALYVDDGGNIGNGTASPAVNIHIVEGNSPALRLQQDGSAGFTPQTWDLAGNETNFFIRDITNGSKLPFKIKPSAPTNSLYIAADGNVGLNDASPDAALNVERSNGTAKILVEETTATAGTYTLLDLQASGASVRPRFSMTNGGASTTWNFDILNVTGDFAFTRGGGGPVFTFDRDSGDLSIEGVFVSNGTNLDVPDYVFAEGYELRSLEEVKAFIDAKNHLPDVPSAAEVKGAGLNITEMQLTLLRKVEELTLYTLEQHETIQKLEQRLESMEAASAQE